MKIQVTQHHIDSGEQSNCYHCPIALALRDAGFGDIRVGYGFMCLDGQQEIPMPPEAAVFAKRFDEGHSCEPFTFEINREPA